MDTLPIVAALSDNELIVHVYACTILRPLLGKTSLGYLTVTNKRVIYHSEVHTMGSKNTIISELPLNDVSGISAFIGNSFNIPLFLLFSAVMYGLTFMMMNFLPSALTSWVTSILLVLPYAIVFLVDKKILNREIIDSFFDNLAGTPMESVIKRENSEIFRTIFRYMFLVGALLFSWNMVFRPMHGSSMILGSGMMLIIYFFIYRMFFGKNRTFSLQIASKTSQGKGITIRGANGISLFRKDDTPGSTIIAKQAEDAELIAHDLGALIMDIQQLGDLGIQKWKKK